MQIYLAGSIENSPDKGRGWRKEILDYCHDQFPQVLVYDPVSIEDDNLQPFKSRTEFANSKLQDGRLNQLHITVMRRFIRNDLRAVASSKFIILYFEGFSSWGSAGEITWAYGSNIPVYTIVKEGLDLESLPSWVIGCSWEIISGMSLLDSFNKIMNYEGEVQ